MQELFAVCKQSQLLIRERWASAQLLRGSTHTTYAQAPHNKWDMANWSRQTGTQWLMRQWAQKGCGGAARGWLGLQEQCNLGGDMQEATVPTTSWGN